MGHPSSTYRCAQHNLVLCSPTSPAYSPTSPSYSPTSPAYSPTSPNYRYQRTCTSSCLLLSMLLRLRNTNSCGILMYVAREWCGLQSNESSIFANQPKLFADQPSIFTDVAKLQVCRACHHAASPAPAVSAWVLAGASY